MVLQYTLKGTLTHKRTCACEAEKVERCTSEMGWNPDGDTYHFRRCRECTGEIAREKHNFSNGYCPDCGYSCNYHQWNDGKCTICNYECPHDNKTLVGVEPINSSEHKATYRCQTCGKELATVENCSGIRTESIDGTYHGEKCTVCGNEVNKQAHNLCNWSVKDANNHTKSCSMCDYSVDEPHYDDEGVRSLDSTQHGKVCDVCGSYFENAKHTFGEDGKCTVCGEECSHTDTENVTEQISGNAESHKVITKCKDCGYIVNETTVAHNFGDWQYEAWYRHIQVCSDCDWTIIENCDEKNNFDYNSNGRNHKVKCNICNGEWTADHEFENDTCIYCAAPQNNNSGDDDDHGGDYDYDPEG